MSDSGLPAAARASEPATRVPPITLDGWYSLHQLYRLDWVGLAGLEPADRERALSDLASRAEGPGGSEGWTGLYRLVGSRVDLLALHFRSSLEGLIEAGERLALAALGDLLLLEHEYVSIVELGLYGLTADLAERVDPADREAWAAAVAAAVAEEREKGFVRRRLYPTQPEGMPYVCYYPMDKRRTPGQNWYTLPLQERAALMRAHGSVGRTYAGKISQVISGSMGLADWEWAVTLWSADPAEFKNIITEMRFDEASAEYAEFGPFHVGVRMTKEDVRGLLPDRA